MHQKRRTSSPQPGAAASGNVFRLEGEYWTIAYNGVVCRLRDSAGLRHVAHLLRRRGDKVAAIELAGARCTPNSRTAQRRFATTHDTELARGKTTRSIRAAMQRIGAHNAPLAEHLRATIKTGAFCSYAPDPRLPVEWRL